MQGFPKGQALVIGVGAYADRRWDVPSAARDAQDLARALADETGAGYLPRNIELLADEQATRAGVLAALGRLANRAAPDGVALISFTCHGAVGDRNVYALATADAAFTSEGGIAPGTGLSVVDLARALREIRARHLLLVVNACFAGQLGPRLSAGGIAAEPLPPIFGGMLTDEAANELVQGSEGQGRAILAAGRPEQRSYLLDGQPNSLFGQALIAAMSGRAGGATGATVDLFELYAYVYRDVVGAARRQVGALQEPTLTLLQGIGRFPVAAYQGPAAPGSAGPQLPAGAPVRELPPININITNRRSVISFEGATVMGDVRTGHVVEGDLTIFGERAEPPLDEPADLRRRLPLLRARVEVARNVDEDARDDAAGKLKQAERAFGQGNPEKAHQRIGEALAILRTMDNGYVRSIVRKLEELASQL